MKKRLISAVIIVPTILAAIMYLPSAGMLIVIIALSTIGIFEFYRMLDLAHIPAFKFVGASCGIVLLLTTYFSFRWGALEGGSGLAVRTSEWAGFVLVGTVLILMMRQFPQKHNDKPLTTIACTLLGVLYVPFMLSFFIKLGLGWSNVSGWTPLIRQNGGYLIFYVVFVTKLTDAGAYFVGRSFGRHKLSPRLSPAKTWEGFFGGVSTGVLVSCLFLWLVRSKLGAVMNVGLYHAVVLGILLAVIGTIGDLAESLLKRAAGAKDSGRLFPGLGGVLDVFDSMIFTAPVCYIYARLLL